MIRFACIGLLICALSGCHPGPRSAQATMSYHQESCGGMPVKWLPQGSERGEFGSGNRLALTKLGLEWNGQSIDLQTLRDYLTDVGRLDPKPVTALVVDPDVTCPRVSAIRAIMNEVGQCAADHRCTEYAAAEWERTHPPVY